MFNRNTNGTLGEREKLWQQKLTGKCFRSFFEFFQTFKRNMKNMFSISFRKHCNKNKKMTCLLWSPKCKFSMPTLSLCQQFVVVLFLSSYRNILCDQSVHIFSKNISISINLLAFYHKCHSLICNNTNYLFCCREWAV